LADFVVKVAGESGGVRSRLERDIYAA
jgi:hypothetical protein